MSCVRVLFKKYVYFCGISKYLRTYCYFKEYDTIYNFIIFFSSNFRPVHYNTVLYGPMRTIK